MILKGSKRGGAMQMARHLLNAEQNEHVKVHEVSGFMSEHVSDALNEIYAISKGTQCKRFMFSLSLSPPEDEKVPVEVFEQALEAIEKKLNMEDQPRVLVFHEKEGRRHAHAVYSRIDSETMTAIDLPYFKNKLMDVSKSLYLEHGWKMPDGFRDKDRGNPLNYTRAEWQQAMRIGRKATDIKRELQESWAASDNRKSFENELGELGYILARGDRRGYVAVDVYGEVYPLNKRKLGIEKQAIEARLGKADTLPSVDEAKDKLSQQLSGLFGRYEQELTALHIKQKQPLLASKTKMVREQRQARKALESDQRARWQKEEIERNSRIRKGFKGIWDKVNGRYWKTRKRNEQETWKAYIRDQKERENLIQAQLGERQSLQIQMNELHKQHDLERQELMRDMSQIKGYEKESFYSQEYSKSRDKDQRSDFGFDGFDLDDDLDHEL